MQVFIVKKAHFDLNLFDTNFSKIVTFEYESGTLTTNKQPSFKSSLCLNMSQKHTRLQHNIYSALITQHKTFHNFSKQIYQVN